MPVKVAVPTEEFSDETGAAVLLACITANEKNVAKLRAIKKYLEQED